MFKISERRTMEALDGKVVSIYEVTDDDGSKLAFIKNGMPCVMVFRDPSVAQRVVDALNWPISPQAHTIDETPSAEALEDTLHGVRMGTGSYQVRTVSGTYNVDAVKQGSRTVWKVELPGSEKVMDDDFDTKREAMKAIAMLEA